MPTDYDALSDEELWNSPLGLRLRAYADKLLAAENERVGIVDKRQLAAHQRMGVDYARDVFSVTGEDMSTRNDNDDPWVYWKSPEIDGLRNAVASSDRTRKGAQEAAKAYIAGLQEEEEERPASEDSMPVGPPWTGDEEAPADEEREATPLDVAGALSWLLTGHAASDKGPFAVHDADGFHDEPYVILPLDAMRKVLDEIPASRW